MFISIHNSFQIRMEGYSVVKPEKEEKMELNTPLGDARPAGPLLPGAEPVCFFYAAGHSGPLPLQLQFLVSHPQALHRLFFGTSI